MENIYIAVRYLHIAAGITAFFVAPVAMVARKGSSVHVFWGRIFFWSMVVVAFTAIPISIYNPNIFLFLVAVFSLHLSVSGYRASAARKAKNVYQSILIDKSIAGASLLVYLLLIGWGLYTALSTADTAFGIIAIAFGLVGLRFSISQLHKLYWPSTTKMNWWFDHMNGMLGSYIATLSAFSAVNFHFLPPVVRWLWPTILGGIGISIWVNYYKKKFNKLPEQKVIAK
ncbi:hypothetical protein Q0590_08065 [Rhodocytophaga aerolata]|uniref:DUF2306 domain-containing protein n=1 Tax=Rhodocytophaga aerolata TaxID=455078 RepID=A0ABT8R612_9BACT|nr:hypothetical protein [Rhodocytophaga aerolata]MDO1446202.1 hypothetical protein [Rhodocytophaga aerolata]